MENNAFDQQLSTLYQQRKQQVIAPKINIEQLQQEKKRSNFYKLMMFLFFGSISSFAVMAIITHLATSSTGTPNKDNTSIEIETVSAAPVPKARVVTVKSQPLIPMQSLPQVPSSIVQVEHNNKPSDHEVNKEHLQLIPPPITIEADLPLPIYKEMPNYPVHQLLEDKDGKVQFSYRIDDQGKVFDIKVESGIKYGEFTNKAKEALESWRYMPNSNYHKRLKVEFEFTPN